MEVKQYHGVTYEEHHNLIFGDYVKISLYDWKYIQQFIEKRLVENFKSPLVETEKISFPPDFDEMGSNGFKG